MNKSTELQEFELLTEEKGILTTPTKPDGIITTQIWKTTYQIQQTVPPQSVSWQTMPTRSDARNLRLRMAASLFVWPPYKARNAGELQAKRQKHILPTCHAKFTKVHNTSFLCGFRGYTCSCACNTSQYMFNVVVIFECPSKSLTFFASTPFFIKSVAYVCRRQWMENLLYLLIFLILTMAP